MAVLTWKICFLGRFVQRNHKHVSQVLLTVETRPEQRNHRFFVSLMTIKSTYHVLNIGTNIRILFVTSPRIYASKVFDDTNLLWRSPDVLRLQITLLRDQLWYFKILSAFIMPSASTDRRNDGRLESATIGSKLFLIRFIEIKWIT